MVARPTTTERFAILPEPFQHGRWLFPRLTYVDAMAMVRLGIIPEDASTELLHGHIVLKDRSSLTQDPMTVGHGHTICVERLSNLRTRINDSRRHVRSQQPLRCSDSHVPEPDFMVIRGRLEDYTDAPAGPDAWCVVEVADSSYERDAVEKLRGYAMAGVEQYVILNLRNRTAEIYTAPDSAAGTYSPVQVVTAPQAVALRVGQGETYLVPLTEILP